jgi:multiple sugar transport system ATP-binding protein
MSTMTISQVTKAYGALSVIHGVDIDIASGAFVVLVGPSGCGKSTLLRMIAGLETITGGEIAIGGKVVNTLPPKDRDIAMVFQNYALYPQMTVAENMGFSLELAGRPKAEIRETVEHAAGILGLTPLLARKPAQLSGGQRQRVAMGRAIVRNPKVFLFDEPLSNLDAKMRVQMRAEIKSLHQRLRTTTVYVTHDQIEAMTLADTIVVMNAGRVEQIGKPLKLYDDPDNMFVAGFLGSPAMNFIEGVVTEGAGPVLQVRDGLQIPLVSLPQHLPADRRVVMGVRPEHIRLDPIRGVPVTVDVVEPTGAETYIAGTLAAGSTAALNVVCVLKERVELEPGQIVSLHFPSETACFFDPHTQQRLR